MLLLETFAITIALINLIIFHIYIKYKGITTYTFILLQRKKKKKIIHDTTGYNDKNYNSVFNQELDLTNTLRKITT